MDLINAEEKFQSISAKRAKMREEFARIDEQLAHAEREAEIRVRHLINQPKPELPSLTKREEAELVTLTQQFNDAKASVEAHFAQTCEFLTQMKEIEGKCRTITNGKKPPRISIPTNDAVRVYINSELPRRLARLWNKLIGFCVRYPF